MRTLWLEETGDGSLSPKEPSPVSLIVRSKGKKRSFRVEIAPPEGSSYARDIAEKYGVTYEDLMA